MKTGGTLTRARQGPARDFEGHRGQSRAIGGTWPGTKTSGVTEATRATSAAFETDEKSEHLGIRHTQVPSMGHQWGISEPSGGHPKGHSGELATLMEGTIREGSWEAITRPIGDTHLEMSLALTERESCVARLGGSR